MLERNTIRHCLQPWLSFITQWVNEQWRRGLSETRHVGYCTPKNTTNPTFSFLIHKVQLRLLADNAYWSNTSILFFMLPLTLHSIEAAQSHLVICHIWIILEPCNFRLVQILIIMFQRVYKIALLQFYTNSDRLYYCNCIKTSTKKQYWMWIDHIWSSVVISGRYPNPVIRLLQAPVLM